MPPPMIDLETTSHERDGWQIVVVSGEVDLSTAPALQAALRSEIDGGAGRVAVDLRQVAFMDSMGLGALIGARRRLSERGGELAVICSDGPVRRVLDVSGLSGVFRTVGSDEELSNG